MLRRAFFLVTFLLLISCTVVMGQCPVNIGFDLGSFANWQGYTGNILSDGSISVPNMGIVSGQHTLISRASKQKDPYGGFDIASPNGSQYVVRLGNSGTGKGAERLTYTFTVPANVNDYSLIYYYAVVFQNPGHTAIQQPKFTANVFDAATNQVTGCGTFSFVASGNLPGFQSTSNSVVYKTWSPVTINLAGYAGKTLRLEFTTNDCSLGGHFGYAYLDINQNCNSPVTGNVQCPGNSYIDLTAPSGFQEYHWFLGTDYTHEIGTQSDLLLKPVPPIGTKYSVRIVPYPGIGCEDTISTIVKASESLVFTTKSSVGSCRSQPVDITTPDVAAGSDTSLTYTYYTNATLSQFIPDPTNITDSGTYYIKATSPGGCTYANGIKVSFLASPSLTIHDPAFICAPATIDITIAAITVGSPSAPNLTYYTDATATIILTTPKKISKSGTYYIKSTNALGCFDIKPVNVIVSDLPVLVTNAISGCKFVDITQPGATNGSYGAANYTYSTNAAGTNTVPNPQNITTSGTYYITAYNALGCFVKSPININVYDYPQITVTDPPSVIFPATVDITQCFTRQTGSAYYFYIDSATTRLVGNATKITTRGTYYIEAVNGNNCVVIYPVHVGILPPVDVDYGVNTFTPNGDGKNDIFRLKLTQSVKMNHFRIYSSWGALLFETTDYLQGWDGTNNGKKMPVGTYYWIMDGYDTYLNKAIQKSGSVTIVM